MSRHEIIAKMHNVVREAKARIAALDAGDYSGFRYAKDAITGAYVKQSYQEMINTANNAIDKTKLPEDFV